MRVIDMKKKTQKNLQIYRLTILSNMDGNCWTNNDYRKRCR